MKIALLEKLNGKSFDVGTLTDALAQLDQEHAAAVAEVDECKRERHSLLLAEASDSKINAAERLIDRAIVKVERADAARPILVARLQEAQSRARTTALEKHRKILRGKFTDLREALRAAVPAQEAVIAARAAAVDETGVRDNGPEFPRIAFPAAALRSDVLVRWTAEIEAAFGVAPATRPAPVPTIAPAPAPHPSARPADSLQHGVRLADASVPRRGEKLCADPLPDDWGPLADDEVRARVVAVGGGYPDVTGVASHHGRIIRVKKAVAPLAAVNGGIEILGNDAAPPPAATGADDLEIGDQPQ